MSESGAAESGGPFLLLTRKLCRAIFHCGQMESFGACSWFRRKLARRLWMAIGCRACGTFRIRSAIFSSAASPLVFHHGHGAAGPLKAVKRSFRKRVARERS